MAHATIWGNVLYLNPAVPPPLYWCWVLTVLSHFLQINASSSSFNNIHLISTPQIVVKDLFFSVSFFSFSHYFLPYFYLHDCFCSLSYHVALHGFLFLLLDLISHLICVIYWVFQVIYMVCLTEHWNKFRFLLLILLVSKVSPEM